MVQICHLQTNLATSNPCVTVEPSASAKTFYNIVSSSQAKPLVVRQFFLPRSLYPAIRKITDTEIRIPITVVSIRYRIRTRTMASILLATVEVTTITILALTILTPAIPPIRATDIPPHNRSVQALTAFAR